VLIIKHSDGGYTLRPESWYRTEREGSVTAEGWKRIVDLRSGIFADPEIAEREAYEAYSWLKIKIET